MRRQFADDFEERNKPNCCEVAIWLVLLVIRLGLEPRTHSLEGCCSNPTELPNPANDCCIALYARGESNPNRWNRNP